MPGAWFKPGGAPAGAEMTRLPALSTRGALLSGITTGEVAESAGAGGGMVVAGVWAIAAVLSRSAAANNAVFILVLLAAARGAAPYSLARRASAAGSMGVKRPGAGFSPACVAIR